MKSVKNNNIYHKSIINLYINKTVVRHIGLIYNKFNISTYRDELHF